MSFVLNGETREVPTDWAEETLLVLLREHFGLIGTKFGCGVGSCGACTVLVNGAATKSCVTRAGDILGQKIRTIEGLETAGRLHRVQQAWLDLAVPQCGFCQAGQIMTAAALLEANPKPTNDEIDAAMDGNLCRCGTYTRIRAAIARAMEAA